MVGLDVGISDGCVDIRKKKQKKLEEVRHIIIISEEQSIQKLLVYLPTL